MRERIQYGAERSCVERIVGRRRRFGRRNDSLQHAVRAEELRALRCISTERRHVKRATAEDR